MSGHLDALVRELADAMKGDADDLPVRLRKAVVFAQSPLTVKIGGSDVAVPVQATGPIPANGTVVWVLESGPRRVMLDASRTPWREPSEDTRLDVQGLWVTVRDKTGTRVALPANAQHHADLVRMCDDRECPPLGTFHADNINHNWGGGGPFGLSQIDSFSTEWTGWFVPEESGVYQFATDGDDASEVMLEGRVISGVYGGKGIDGAFQNRLANTHSLIAGRRYLLCFRQEEGGGGAGALLYYRTPAMVAAAATAVIVPKARLRRPPLWMLPQLKAATYSDWEYVGVRPTGRFGGAPVPFSGAAYNWGTNWDQVGFRRTQEGMVHLRGLIGQDATADVVFTLPSGYRRPLPPSGQDTHNTHHYVRTGKGVGDVFIRPNGTVYVGTVDTWTDLSDTPPFQAWYGGPV